MKFRPHLSTAIVAVLVLSTLFILNFRPHQSPPIFDDPPERGGRIVGHNYSYGWPFRTYVDAVYDCSSSFSLKHAFFNVLIAWLAACTAINAAERVARRKQAPGLSKSAQSAACFFVLFLSLAVFAGQPTAPSLPQIPRTPQQIDQLIQQEGLTPPSWWNSVKLSYPPTLLIHWEKPQPKEPWTPSKYLGQYIWSIINENPGKWKEGARLLHHVVDLNKDNPEALTTSKKALARIYQHLLQDYPRAAYWWRSAGVDEEEDEALGLAECYFKLGNKDMAKNILTKIGDDYTRHGGVIKMWADMGEFKKALELAEIKAKDDDADVAYLMAGDACRLQGKTKEALDYYQKSMAATKNGRDNKQTKARAQASFDAVKLFDALDLKRMPDGTYSSSSYGYAGQVNVSVVVKTGRIDSVKIGAHQEKQYYGALTETPAQIIKKQTVKGLDTYASATITSEAIINASAKALSNAMK